MNDAEAQRIASALAYIIESWSGKTHDGATLCEWFDREGISHNFVFGGPGLDGHVTVTAVRKQDRRTIFDIAAELSRREATTLDEGCAALIRAGAKVTDLEIVSETYSRPSDGNMTIHHRAYVRAESPDAG
jgi:hypothetical protein